MRGFGFKLLTIISIISIFITTSLCDIVDVEKYLRDNVICKQLSNDITVVMLDRGYAPTLACIISFRIGSVDESYRSIGVAHMLEHMLFKGTDKIGTKDFNSEKKILSKIELIGERLDRLRLKNPEDKRIVNLEKQLKNLQKDHAMYVVSSPYSKIYAENGGIGFNASTSKDKTLYFIELPASKLELWARLESERLRNPVLREFYLERDTVQEERLMRYESIGTSKLFESFLASAFLAHPYRHPTIGWMSNIKYFAIKDVKQFYNTYYTPSRMTITIVGKQDTKSTFRLLEDYFGKIKKRDEPTEIAIKEPVQKGERRFEIYFESNPYLLIGWHKPTFPSRDDYIFDIIERVLSDGRTSRLYNSLVIEKGLAASVGSWNGFPGVRYDNLFIISAKPKKPHTPEVVEKAIYDEIERIQADLREDEIQKILNKIESSFVFDLASNRSAAHILNYYQTIYNDWGYIIDYLHILKTISIKDIKDVHRRYLTKENRTVGLLRDSRKKR